MEYALVTLCMENGTWQQDMELPARMKIQEVALKVLETLKAIDEDRFGEMSKLRFVHDGKVLNDMASLADYKIWDGSKLYIRQEKIHD